MAMSAWPAKSSLPRPSYRSPTTPAGVVSESIEPAAAAPTGSTVAETSDSSVASVALLTDRLSRRWPCSMAVLIASVASRTSWPRALS